MYIYIYIYECTYACTLDDEEITVEPDRTQMTV